MEKNLLVVELDRGVDFVVSGIPYLARFVGLGLVELSIC